MSLSSPLSSFPPFLPPSFPPFSLHLSYRFPPLRPNKAARKSSSSFSGGNVFRIIEEGAEEGREGGVEAGAMARGG